MAKVNLTVTRIADFSCPEDKPQAFLWDSTAPGLGVRATAGGKAYIFQTRLAGKTIRATIGDCRAWLLDGARNEARRLQSLVDQGIDPRQEKADRIEQDRRKRAEQEAKRQEATRQEVARSLLVQAAWDAYMEVPHPRWGDRHRTDHINAARPGGEKPKRGKKLTTPGPLAPLMSKRLADVTADVMADWLTTESEKRAAQTRLAYGYFRTFIKWCAVHPEYAEIVRADCCDEKKVRDHLPEKKSKKDCLQREQLAGWFAAVREMQNPVLSAYLQGLLLSGARREELARLKWSDVDFRWRSMTIADKVEDNRTIPLTPYLAQLLEALPRRNQWVFSSPTAKTGYIQEPRIAHNRAVAVAGIEDLTIHGLRRSFGSLCEWVEVPAGVVAQIMGHKPSATAEKHYRVRPLDLLRMWHEKIEAWMLEQAGIEFDAEQAAPGLKLVSTKAS